MNKLMELFHAIGAHWSTILIWIGFAISVLGSLRNALDKTDWSKKQAADHWLDDLLDALSFVAKYGHKGIIGRLSIPLLPSIPSSSAPAPEKK